MLSANFISVVQAGLVLPAIPDDCYRRPLQGIYNLAEGWTARAHIQSLRDCALPVFCGPDLTHGTHVSWGDEIASKSTARPTSTLKCSCLDSALISGVILGNPSLLSAAAALYALNLVYTHATGLYFFIDTNIPAAVFLGLHLLITDPATSPKKNIGKVIFGGLYGAGVFGFYWLLARLGVPTFYDKLLIVPPLNLTVRLSTVQARRWSRVFSNSHGHRGSKRTSRLWACGCASLVSCPRHLWAAAVRR